MIKIASLFNLLKKYDSDGNKEISDKEFEALANDLNKGADENSKVKADDLKSFYSHVLELGNSDTEKVSVTDVEKEDSSGEDDNKTYFYIHWIDASAEDPQAAGEAIKGGMEKYIRRIWE